MFSSFYGKLLVIGEYTVILGEKAFAIPLRSYSGRLRIDDIENDQNIAPFIQYLGALHHIDLDQEQIEKISLERLVFDSNIPIGYGAGSSGALTAAVYDAFVINKKDDLASLKQELSSMEDFFHGSSSGLDPIVAFTNEAILFGKEEFSKVEMDEKVRQSLSHFTLIDTGITRSTGPLVEIFKSKMGKDTFMVSLQELLISANKLALKGILEFDLGMINKGMEKISKFQFEHMNEMIPDNYKDLWSNTLSTDGLSMKLCGAGGGGFLLAFAKNPEIFESWSELNSLKLKQIVI